MSDEQIKQLIRELDDLRSQAHQKEMELRAALEAHADALVQRGAVVRKTSHGSRALYRVLKVHAGQGVVLVEAEKLRHPGRGEVEHLTHWRLVTPAPQA